MLKDQPIEKQRITVGVAVAAAFAAGILLFSAGRATGSDKSSVDVQLTNISSQLVELKADIKTSISNQNNRIDNLDSKLNSLQSDIAVLKSRVDDKADRPR